MLVASDRQNFSGAVFMKFRANIRNMQAAVILAVSAFGLASPAIAQVQAPVQTEPSTQQPVNPTVQVSEPLVNDPVVAAPPPVITPVPVPTPAPKTVTAPKGVKKYSCQAGAV